MFGRFFGCACVDPPWLWERKSHSLTQDFSFIVSLTQILNWLPTLLLLTKFPKIFRFVLKFSVRTRFFALVWQTKNLNYTSERWEKIYIVHTQITELTGPRVLWIFLDKCQCHSSKRYERDKYSAAHSIVKAKRHTEQYDWMTKLFRFLSDRISPFDQIKYSQKKFNLNKSRFIKEMRWQFAAFSNLATPSTSSWNQCCCRNKPHTALIKVSKVAVN